MNNYQMFRKIQERDNIIKKYSNDTKEDLIDLVIEKDNIIDNLQSKIDKINQYIKETKESDSFTKLPSGKITDIGYCLDTLGDIEDIIKEDK